MNTSSAQPRIRIQLISRDFLVENTHGSGTYVLDLLRYLRKLDFEIEYTLLEPVHGKRVLCHVVPRTVAELAVVTAKDSLQWGRAMFEIRSPLDWMILPFRLLYYQLPESFKEVYRAAKFSLRKLHHQEVNGTGIESTARDALPRPDEIAFVRDRYVEFAPDVVIADYAWLGHVLDVMPSNSLTLKVILTHDILHQRVADFERLGVDSGHLGWTWDTESAMLRKAQVLLAIQEQDASALKAMAPDCEVIYLPMAAGLRMTTVRQVPGRCLFVGSEVDHNVLGLRWFLEQVWPQVVRAVPHSSLHVCGTICHAVRGRFPNVRFLGRLEDLGPEYGAAEVCLIPLQVGSGLKIKLVEALSYGRACVSTKFGVQGMPEMKDTAVLVANTPAEFAAAVGKLLTDPVQRSRMEAYAHHYVTARLSPEIAYQPFVDRIYAHVRRTQSTRTQAAALVPDFFSTL